MKSIYSIWSQELEREGSLVSRLVERAAAEPCGCGATEDSEPHDADEDEDEDDELEMSGLPMRGFAGGLWGPGMSTHPSTGLPRAYHIGEHLPAPLGRSFDAGGWADDHLGETPTNKQVQYMKVCPPAGTEHKGQEFRRCKSGGCRCQSGTPGSDLTQISNAFKLAYQVIRSAEKELDYWNDQPKAYKGTMWQGYIEKASGSLAHWFGRTDAGRFEERWVAVYHTIRDWSFRFRNGYIPGFPVKLKCYKHKDPSYSASHVEPNVINLYKQFFDKSPNQKAITLLHEMGHMSRGDLFPWLLPAPLPGAGVGLGLVLVGGPRDRRNDVCVHEKEKCYRTIGSTLPNNNELKGPNPRALVAEFEGGSKEGYRDMLDNIDNYVCYMWNRWVDRGYCRLQF